VIRRLHVQRLVSGEIALGVSEAHHARDVLRLRVGDEVELFDDAGAVARGCVVRCDSSDVVVQAELLRMAESRGSIVVASAVPKGERADWMVEKLSELGVDRFIPLRAVRSVVIPAGKNKRDRWSRLTIESAKQSRRPGVMRIDDLTDLDEFLDTADAADAIVLSTDSIALSLPIAIQSQIANRKPQISLLVGPEGGWSDQELSWFSERNLTRARLTATILRVETAAVAATAIIAAWRDRTAAPADPRHLRQREPP
jgi:16S rRNA (uracil1498-N3)-methyltransferase